MNTELNLTDKTLSLEEAREILGPDCKLSDEELQHVILTLRRFCQVIYVYYVSRLEKDRIEKNDLPIIDKAA